MYTYDKPKAHKSMCPQGTALANPVVAFGKDFCLETSMHGFQHIAAPRRHWVERLLWVAATSLAIWGAIDVSLGQLQRYNENPTVVTLEKDFKSWRFSLPGVTTCNTNRTNPSKLENVVRNLWAVEPSDEKYEYYKSFIEVVANSDLLHLEGYEEYKEDKTLEVDLYQLAIDVMPELDAKTKSSESVPLKWTPVMTEAGACYSINSLAIDDVALAIPNPNDTKIYPLTCKYGASSSCFVMLEVNSKYNSKVYYHSPYDVMDIAEPATFVIYGLTRTMEVSVIETGCGKGVKDLNPARRACLFTDEPANGRKVYSTNSCRKACRSELAMEACGCRPFYYFYEGGPFCTPAGMACLAKHAQDLASIRKLKCLCASQCLYSVFRQIALKDQKWNGGPFTLQPSIKYVVQPPKVRYTREIIFHFQDLVVSFGGAAGLFLGASFISFVEILYFLLERILRAVSVKNNKSEGLSVQQNTKKTFEEQRIMELTTILERDLYNQKERIWNTIY